MVSVIDSLPMLLRKIDPPGNFASSGSCVCPMPDVEVTDVGPIAFPLLTTQAKELVAAAEAAPYGRGGDTIIDASVRRTWQIGTSRLSVKGDVWHEQTLPEIVTEAARSLGVTGAADAQLYKLLVYDAGSFFADHRDSEKVDGMFATLVVALPSRHTGGALIVRHAGREVDIDLTNASGHRIKWAAFYADCEHEVRPIDTGHRLCLVYNLVLTKKKTRRAAAPPDHRAPTLAAAAALRAWSDGSDRRTRCSTCSSIATLSRGSRSVR